LEAAREVWPRTRICAIVTPRLREMLAGVEYIDEMLIGAADPLSVRGRSAARETEAQLRAARFDVGILLGGDQYAPLLYRAGVPIRVGPAPCVYEPLLTHRYAVDDGRTWGPDERLGAIRALGVQAEARVPRLTATAEGRREFAQWRGARDGGGDAFLVLHPFGSTARQRWPLDRVPELAARVFRQLGLRTILAGGGEFRDAAAGLAGEPALWNAVGEFSIPALLATIEAARLVATTDSGPFHMAGALGRPIVGLFRGSRPEHAARYPRARVLFGQDAACDVQCGWNRCHAAPCRQLTALRVDAVLDAIEASIPPDKPSLLKSQNST
jgi:ADP-heptose:LPS heptosyltransferase